jgi:hypothetical protein
MCSFANLSEQIGLTTLYELRALKDFNIYS